MFVVRRVPTQTLDVLAKGEKLEGLTAIGKVRDVARALAHCEKSAVFPGPLRPGKLRFCALITIWSGRVDTPGPALMHAPQLGSITMAPARLKISR